MIVFLDNSTLRAKGVLGLREKDIRGKAFAFLYPFAFARKFFTWFCPSLRILAFSDVDGSVIFDEVIDRWRFVNIPATRLVIEMHPENVLLAQTIKDEVSAKGVTGWLSQNDRDQSVMASAVGGTMIDDPFRELLLALLESAIGELKRSLGTTPPEKIATFADFLRWRSKGVDMYQRGQLLSSAAFLLDIQDQVPFNLPPTAVKLAGFILKAESQNADEVLAASVAGAPWIPRHRIGACFRCKGKGTFRQVIVDQSIPVESSWRLLRPENHVCLCRGCAQTLREANGERAYLVTAYMYWGMRFQALRGWHQAYISGILPSGWNTEHYPLWPREYGGDRWESGSGALEHCAPMFGMVNMVSNQMYLVGEIQKPIRSRRAQLQQLQHLLN